MSPHDRTFASSDSHEPKQVLDLLLHFERTLRDSVGGSGSAYEKEISGICEAFMRNRAYLESNNCQLVDDYPNDCAFFMSIIGAFTDEDDNLRVPSVQEVQEAILEYDLACREEQEPTSTQTSDSQLPGPDGTVAQPAADHSTPLASPDGTPPSAEIQGPDQAPSPSEVALGKRKAVEDDPDGSDADAEADDEEDQLSDGEQSPSPHLRRSKRPRNTKSLAEPFDDSDPEDKDFQDVDQVGSPGDGAVPAAQSVGESEAESASSHSHFDHQIYEYDSDTLSRYANHKVHQIPSQVSNTQCDTCFDSKFRCYEFISPSKKVVCRRCARLRNKCSTQWIRRLARANGGSSSQGMNMSSSSSSQKRAASGSSSSSQKKAASGSSSSSKKKTGQCSSQHQSVPANQQGRNGSLPQARSLVDRTLGIKPGDIAYTAITNLQTRYTLLEGSNRELRSKCAHLESKFSTYDKDRQSANAFVQQNIDCFREQLDVNTQDIQATREDIQTTREDLQETRKDVEDVQTKVVGLEDTTRALAESMKSAVKDMTTAVTKSFSEAVSGGSMQLGVFNALVQYGSLQENPHATSVAPSSLVLTPQTIAANSAHQILSSFNFNRQPVNIPSNIPVPNTSSSNSPVTSNEQAIIDSSSTSTGASSGTDGMFEMLIDHRQLEQDQQHPPTLTPEQDPVVAAEKGKAEKEKEVPSEMDKGPEVSPAEKAREVEGKEAEAEAETDKHMGFAPETELEVPSEVDKGPEVAPAEKAREVGGQEVGAETDKHMGLAPETKLEVPSEVDKATEAQEVAEVEKDKVMGAKETDMDMGPAEKGSDLEKGKDTLYDMDVEMEVTPEKGSEVALETDKAGEAEEVLLGDKVAGAKEIDVDEASGTDVEMAFTPDKDKDKEVGATYTLVGLEVVPEEASQTGAAQVKGLRKKTDISFTADQEDHEMGDSSFEFDDSDVSSAGSTKVGSASPTSTLTSLGSSRSSTPEPPNMKRVRSRAPSTTGPIRLLPNRTARNHNKPLSKGA